MTAAVAAVAAVVKECPTCNEPFSTQALLEDLMVDAVGMMLIDEDLTMSAYFFNHLCPGCGTTFSVAIDKFRELIKEEIPDTLLAGSPVCDGHCTRLRDLADCDNPCSNAPYRRFLINVLHSRSGRRQPGPDERGPSTTG